MCSDGFHRKLGQQYQHRSEAQIPARHEPRLCAPCAHESTNSNLQRRFHSPWCGLSIEHRNFRIGESSSPRILRDSNWPWPSCTSPTRSNEAWSWDHGLDGKDSLGSPPVSAFNTPNPLAYTSEFLRTTPTATPGRLNDSIVWEMSLSRSSASSITDNSSIVWQSTGESAAAMSKTLREGSP